MSWNGSVERLRACVKARDGNYQNVSLKFNRPCTASFYIMWTIFTAYRESDFVCVYIVDPCRIIIAVSSR